MELGSLKEPLTIEDTDVPSLDLGQPTPQMQNHKEEGLEKSADEDGDQVEGEDRLDPDEDDTMQAKINGSDQNQDLPPSEPRFHPIQVLLTTPANRDLYRKIPHSREVEKVIEEIEAGDEIWYSFEFEDGRIDQLPYDDLLALRNGDRAVERFHKNQVLGADPARMSRYPSKRRRLGNHSESEDLIPIPKKRLRQLVSRRRSARQNVNSGQATPYSEIDSGHDDNLDGTNIYEDDGEDDSDDDNSFQINPRSQMRGVGPNRRTTRSHKTVAKRYAQPQSSEDELANVSGRDDAFVPVTSDLVKASRSSARKRKSRGRPSARHTRDKDTESSIEFEPTRRSGRTKNTKDYRVPDIEDDFQAVEDNDAAIPKHVSVKEIFQPLPRDSKFEKMHSNICETCQGNAHSGKGPLVYCQGCSYSYHKVCLGIRSQREHRVSKIAPNSFVLQCRICIGIYQKKDPNAPSFSMCQTCKLDGPSCAEFTTKKTPKQEEKLRLENGGEDPVTNISPDLINNADSLLFRCTSCKRGFHFEHLPSLVDIDETSEDLRDSRLKEYSSENFRCKECVNTEQKIHALVAWRPVDQDSYVAGTTCTNVPEDQKEYLVKWERKSHFHDTWMPGAWIYGTAASSMRASFNRREDNLPKMTAAEAIDEEWLLADVFLSVKYRTSRNPARQTMAKDLARLSDVEEVFVKFQGLSYTESVFDTPPPRNSGAPWDAFCAAYDEYVRGIYFPYVSDHKMAERIKQYRGLDFAAECELKVQPRELRRGNLMEYQLEGLNWLLFNFHKAQNAILADEMGLGKTIQVVSFITALVHDKPNCWPFLIVVPNSTCPNWRRELKQWSPKLRVVTYHGGRMAQDLAFRHELFPDGPKAGMKAHVVIMSYEAAVDAKAAFRSVKWAGLIVDEGQRLKNDQSLLYLALRDMNIPFRLLLTGTPLQNNKRELFNLLQFVDPSRNAESLDAKYAVLTKENIPELHKLIRPYFLRRTKVQVLKFLPPMAQIILPVTMTFLQEKLSKSIISRNSELIKAIISKSKVKAGERKSLNNILMELRRCLCHPFLFNDSVEDRTITDPATIQRNLVEASGKLMMLNIMLPKLRERKHRVLIFSQFLLSLTILEDFLTSLGLPHARIDGQLSALQKQKRIDEFNAPDSPLFAMLLSTRAGGVGINLASADTVIIYDPDFNPHQDIQALSRAHRIGQTHKVLCFQLMTKDTVEEKIMQIGRKKMALDHALIESMDADDDAGDDLESILKHGAETLFSDNARDKIVYDEASIDKLLDRSQMESTNTGDDQSAESQFSFARVWANDKGTLTTNIDGDAEDDNTPAGHSVWENILKQRQEEHELELAAQQQEYGRGARRRNQDVRYTRVGSFIEGIDDDYHLTEPKPQDRDEAGSDIGIEDELYIDTGNMDVESELEDTNFSDKKGKATEQFVDVPPAANKPPELLGQPKQPQEPRRKRGRPRKPTPELPLNLGTQGSRRPPDPVQQPTTQQLPSRPQLFKQAANQQSPHPWPVQQPMVSQWKPHQLWMQYPTNRSQAISHPPLPPSHTNQNLMFSIPGFVQRQPGQEQNLGRVKQSFRQPHNPSTPIPAPPATSRSNPVIPSTNTLAPGVPGIPDGVAKSQPGSNVVACLVCGAAHSLQTCINFDSEISLRIAIDSLRNLDEDPKAVQELREILFQRLREVQKRKAAAEPLLPGSDATKSMQS